MHSFWKWIGRIATLRVIFWKTGKGTTNNMRTKESQCHHLRAQTNSQLRVRRQHHLEMLNAKVSCPIWVIFSWADSVSHVTPPTSKDASECWEYMTKKGDVMKKPTTPLKHKMHTINFLTWQVEFSLGPCATAMAVPTVIFTGNARVLICNGYGLRLQSQPLSHSKSYGPPKQVPHQFYGPTHKTMLWDAWKHYGPDIWDTLLTMSPTDVMS